MPSMSVAENIWIGREPVNACGVISHRELHRRTRELLGELVDRHRSAGAELRSLSIAYRQMVEIAKAISYDSQLLIMDEPTSALTERDAERLFADHSRPEGAAQRHPLHQPPDRGALRVADEISVLRDGRHVGTDSPANLTRERIIRMMVGRELAQIVPAAPARAGAVRLAVRELTLRASLSRRQLRAARRGDSRHRRAGRIRAQQARRGVVRREPGRLRTDSHRGERGADRLARERPSGAASPSSPRTARKAAVSCALSVLENLAIAVLGRDFVRLGFVRGRALARACDAMMRACCGVRTPDQHERIENLSGGNQQKVLIGRWLLTQPADPDPR